MSALKTFVFASAAAVVTTDNQFSPISATDAIKMNFLDKPWQTLQKIDATVSYVYRTFDMVCYMSLPFPFDDYVLRWNPTFTKFAVEHNNLLNLDSVDLKERVGKFWNLKKDWWKSLSLAKLRNLTKGINVVFMERNDAKGEFIVRTHKFGIVKLSKDEIAFQDTLTLIVPPLVKVAVGNSQEGDSEDRSTRFSAQVFGWKIGSASVENCTVAVKKVGKCVQKSISRYVKSCTGAIRRSIMKVFKKKQVLKKKQVPVQLKKKEKKPKENNVLELKLKNFQNNKTLQQQIDKFKY